MKYDFSVTNELIEWRGPAPFYFVEIGDEDSKVIKAQSKMLTYGWGVIYCHGKIGKTEFQSAMIPKDGRYRIPVKDAVRKSESLELGDEVTVKLNLGKKL